MFVVLSSPRLEEDEIEIVNQLFESKIEVFHLRKPSLSKELYEQFLKQVPLEHKRKIVLHQHHELAGKYNVKGLHLREENRQNLGMEKVKQLRKEAKSKNLTLSSSFHSLEEVKLYENLFNYVFISPVFESISKPGYSSSSEFRVPSSELRKTKMIALGGIQESNVGIAKNLGFDGVAVLGAIWQEPSKALSRFETIKKEYETAFNNSKTQQF